MAVSPLSGPAVDLSFSAVRAQPVERLEHTADCEQIEP
jgi:hypothetical protein